MMSDNRKYNINPSSFLQHVLETINGSIIIIRPQNDYKIEFISKYQLLEGFTHSCDSLIGTSFLNLVFPDDIEKIKDFLLNNSEPNNSLVEIRIQNSDDEFIWVKISKKILEQKDLEDKILIYLEDISKQKDMELQLDQISKEFSEFNLAEQKLKESEEIFRNLFNETPHFLSVWRKVKDNFILFDYNNNAIIFTGVSNEKNLSINTSEITPKVIGRDFEESLNRSFEEKSSFTEEVEFYFESLKRKREILVTYKYIPPDLVLVHVEDITSRNRIKNQLKKSKKKFKMLFKGTPHHVIAWRKKKDDFIVSDYNNNAYNYTNGRIRESLGTTASQWYQIEQNRPDLIENLNKCFEEKSNFMKEVKFYDNFLNRERNLLITYSYIPPNFVLTHTEDITPRRKGMQKLKESEEKYRTIIENAKEGYYEVDLKGNYTLVNNAYCKLLEYSREEIIGKSYKNFTTEKTGKNAFTIFNRVYNTGIEQSSFEYELITKSGKIKYGDTSIHLIYDAEGNKIGFRGFLKDITEKKLAEEKLKKSEERFRKYFKGGANFIVSWQRVKDDFILIDYNDGAIKVSNGKIQERLGQTASQIFIKEINRPDLVENMNICFDQKKNYTKEVRRHVLFAGEERDLRIKYQYVPPDLVLTHNEDITERVKREQELKESEEKYRTIIENAKEGYYEVDLRGNYTFVNNTFCNLIEYSREEIIGMNYKSFRTKEESEKAFTTFNMVYNTGIEQASFEYELITKSGKIKYGDTSIHLIFDAEGNKIGFRGFLKDITEKKLAEEKLKESEEKYRSLFENMNAGFAYHEVVVNENNQPIDYIYHEVNPAFEELTGLKKEDLLGKRVTEAILRTKNDLADWIGKFGKVGLTGIPLTVEDFSEALNRWFKVSGYSPKKGFFAVTFTDITERKKAEENLKESEMKFSTIAEQSLLGIVILQDYKFKYVNQKFADLGGRTVEEVSNWGPREFLKTIHPEDRSIVIEHARKRQIGIETEEPGYECRAFKKNGEMMWVQTYSKIITYNGKYADLITIIDITNRKLAEQELKKSEEKYRSLINNISDLIMEIELNNEITYSSPQIKEMLGYSENEATGMDFSKLVHPDDLSEITRGRREALKTGNIISIEFRLRHKEGYYIPVFTRGSLVSIGDSAKFIGVFRDVTKRKKAEEDLKESERKFRTIAEQSLMGICIIQDFEIKYLNKQMAEIYGYPIDEVKKWKAREFLKVIHPDSRDMVMPQLKKGRQIDPEIVTHYIAKIITKKGNIKWVENYTTPITYRGKSADLLTQIDITSKMDAEDKIKASEEKYHHLYENSPFAILLFNVKGEIVDCNYSCEKLSGFTKNDLVGKSFKNVEFVPEHSIPFLLEDFKDLLKGKSIESRETQLFTKNGDLRWVSYQVSTFFIEKEMIFQVIIQDITDRKKAEQELIESEEKYHNLFETSPSGVILTDMDGIILECNSALEKITGYSLDEFIGEKYFDVDIYLENGPNIIAEGARDLFGEKKLEYVEFPIKHKDEHTVWVRTYLSRITMRDQTYVISIVYDITTQKKAEVAIRKSEEQYRNLLETSSVGVMELDVINNELIYINPKLLSIIGYERDELSEDVFLTKLIHQKDLNKILRTNEEADLEFRIFDKQGKLKWLSGKRIPNFGKNNEIIGIRIWLDDITEKKIYEELIYELNINFLNFTADIRKNIELLLNTGLKLLNGDLIIYVHKINHEGEVQYQIITSDNESYTYDSQELFKRLFVRELFNEGHDFPQEFHDINEHSLANLDPFIKKVQAKGCFGKAIKSQDGLDNSICVFYQNNPEITGQDKLVLFLIGDAIEIEQRRWQVQQDLREQNITLNKINKLKTELFSRTSHELKTPLISIKGFTELLLTLHKSKLDTETISILEEIKDGSKRLEKIINLLLESTKLEAGQLELKKKKEDLTFLINFCVKELKGLAKLRNQSILFDPSNKVEALFDKERIYEVISNLLLNAVKYTPPGGTISIETKEDKDSYIISIKDNGIGFTDEEKNQVFKQFGKIERYGQGWDVAIEGTGLGLYITKKLVELHNGKIWLESEGRDKGTIFYFSIPK